MQLPPPSDRPPSTASPLHHWPALLLAGVLLAAQAAPAQAQRADSPVTLNFVQAEIEAVARTMAMILGRPLVVDPRVRGTLSLATDGPVSPQEGYRLFLAALRLAGFAMVDAGGLLQLVPEADAKLQGGAVSAGPPPAGSQVITQIFRLQHESAANLVPILRPLISPNQVVNVNPGSNALVVTDYADNLQRIGRIVAALDTAEGDAQVLPLRHAVAADLAPLVQRLVDTGGASAAAPGQADTPGRTAVIAEPRTNTLVVRTANRARMALVRSTVERLDEAARMDATGNLHVVYLRNADAVRMAATLRAAIMAAAAQPVAAPLPGGAAGASTQPTPPPSTGGQIQADPALNALVISAPAPVYRQLRAVIEQLDARRAQVFVECLVAEVNHDKAAEFGIQWQNVDQSGGTIRYQGTNFGSGGSNIITLNTQAESGSATASRGLNLGLLRDVGGSWVLGFLARALEESGEGNVLSAPRLLTLDNEEARIVIGQNVPFVTGQYASTATTAGGTVNPFQTIERKDVGLTLRVRPQISEAGTVKLQIFQEVSSVQASTAQAANGPTTNKRSIESTVLVEDGGLVVLGGLLQDEYAGTEEKVPVAGDLPLLGNLFRSRTRSRKKTNLMVFIRPVVLRDQAEAARLSLDRYAQMLGEQRRVQPVPSPVLPVQGAPVLPPAPGGERPPGGHPE
jgi:general secretion pathway protein D